MRCTSAVEVLLPDNGNYTGERLVLQCVKSVAADAGPGEHVGPCDPGEVRFTWRHNLGEWEDPTPTCSTCGLPQFPHPRRHPVT